MTSQSRTREGKGRSGEVVVVGGGDMIPSNEEFRSLCFDFIGYLIWLFGIRTRRDATLCIHVSCTQLQLHMIWYTKRSQTF